MKRLDTEITEDRTEDTEHFAASVNSVWFSVPSVTKGLVSLFPAWF
jgi:hypothetical protein